MTDARTTSSVKDFPFQSPRICYIEVAADGSVAQLRYAPEIREGRARAATGESRLYAVWPGTYRSDLFVVDS